MVETILSVRLPENEGVAIEKLVFDGKYLNASDFLRKAVTNELKRLKVRL